jgi:hypothetical protein
MIAEAFRGLIQGKALDKDGTQGFEAAVQGLLGIEEELPADVVVHGAGLGRLTNFGSKPSRHDIPNQAAPEARTEMMKAGEAEKARILMIENNT